MPVVAADVIARVDQAPGGTARRATLSASTLTAAIRTIEDAAGHPVWVISGTQPERRAL